MRAARARGRALREQNAAVAPLDKQGQINARLKDGISGKGIKAGETLAGVVERNCPDIYGLARSLGYDLTFDIPENTHEAICRGETFYRLTRSKPLN